MVRGKERMRRDNSTIREMGKVAPGGIVAIKESSKAVLSGRKSKT